MPGDPKECRQQALECIRLAQTSASPQARDRFASLAWTWIRLADDLERNLTVLEGLDDETDAERLTAKPGFSILPALSPWRGGETCCLPDASPRQ